MLAPSSGRAATLVHWGASLGDLTSADLDALVAAHHPRTPHSGLDEGRWPTLLALAADGFTGRPGVEGWRPGARGAAGRTWSPRPAGWTWEVTDDGPGTDAALRLEGADEEAGWGVGLDLELTREGLVRLRTRVRNIGDDALVPTAVRCALPVGPAATELLDLTGRWCRERHPQRRDWHQGTHLREGRHGRTGHDATLLLAAGTPGFAFTRGEVWAVHTAWSGDHATYAERTPEGECRLGGGELLGPGEVVLAPGEEHASPWLVGAYSAVGASTRSPRRLHAWTRRYAERPARRARCWSTPGRPSTSTTPWTGSRRWSRPRPRSARSASCSTTAGSAAAATTVPGSATGRSTRPSGPRAWAR